MKQDYLNGKSGMSFDSVKTMSGSYSGFDLSIYIEKYQIYLVTQSL